jgi:IS605 OrfB family transposase
MHPISDLLFTHGFLIKDAAVLRAADAVCLQWKNLTNQTIHCICVVLDALESGGRVKASATPYQLAMLARANAAVLAINAKRAKPTKTMKGKKGQPTSSTSPKEKKAPYDLFGQPGKDGRCPSPFQILEMPILGPMIAGHLDPDGLCVYECLPGAVASEAVQRVIVNFRSWQKSFAAWRESPGQFTGKPKRPGYLGKNERGTVVFPAANAFYFKKGRPDPNKPLRFNAFEGRALWRDYAKTKPLAQADLDALIAVDLAAWWKAARFMGKLPDDARLAEVRLVPKRDGSVRIDFVSKIAVTAKPGSFADKIQGRLANQVNLERVADAKLDEMVEAFLEELTEAELPLMAGTDPGVSNFLSVAATDGFDGILVSGARYEKKIACFDAAIDQLKSALMTPDLRKLQVRREAAWTMKRLEDELTKATSDRPALARELAEARSAWATFESEGGRPAADPSLSPEELTRLKRGLSEIYSNPSLIALYEHRRAWAEDFMHKLSSGVVKRLVARGIELLVLGHNPGWKQEAPLGRKQNRRLHWFAHDTLFHMLRYKARAAGLVVADVEESWTSRTSFAACEPLKTHPKAAARKRKVQTKEPVPAAEQNMKNMPASPPAGAAAPVQAVSQAALGAAPREGSETAKPTTEGCPPAQRASQGSAGAAAPAPLGRRGRGKKRHRFATPSAPAGWRAVHADLNGAFNILRKACPAFRWRKGLSAHHELTWVSPKTGLSKMRLRREAETAWAA